MHLIFLLLKKNILADSTLKNYYKLHRDKSFSNVNN